MFRQTIQKKFLSATTTRRCYYNITGAEVDKITPKLLLRARSVNLLEGGFQPFQRSTLKKLFGKKMSGKN